MRIKEFMTLHPTFCLPQTNLQEVAKLMRDKDCGEIPVVESLSDPKPVGVITDRDIVCRAVGLGRNPAELTAGDCMTRPCVTVEPETPLRECCKIMMQNHIRRVPVVDETGRCVGIVSQADLALRVDPAVAAGVLLEVSRIVAA